MSETTTAAARRRWCGPIGCVFAAAGLIVGAGAAGASAPGAPDVRFGSDATLSLDMPGSDHPSAMVRTATGNLAVTIQSDSGLWVAMVTPDGHLDHGFGGSGIVPLELAAETIGAGLHPTADGGVVVAAWLYDEQPAPVGDQRFAVAKLRADGRRDLAYGDGGLATTVVGELAPLDHQPAAFAVASDGSAVVVGITGAATFYGGAAVAALMRFTPSGERDTSFGIGGFAPVVTDAAYPWITDATFAPDGGILIAETNHAAGPVVSEMLVRRFTADGRPDVTFGVAGVARVPALGDWKTLTDIEVDDRGRIVCYGYAAPGLTAVIIGRLDPSSAIDPDAGFSPLVARLDSKGWADETFGRAGVAMLHTDGNGVRLAFAGDIDVTRDGAFVTTYEERASTLTTRILRIDSRGAIDRAFADGQSLRLPMQNTFAVVALHDRVVVAGARTWQEGGTILAAYTR